MLLNDKFVYIHIPKTAGNFMRCFLSSEFPGTTDVPVYHWHKPVWQVPESHRNVFKFVSIRNPWDWYVSFYTFQKKGNGFWYNFFTEDKKRDFKTMMRNMLSTDFLRKNAHVKHHPVGDPTQPETIPVLEYMLNLDIGFYSYVYIYLCFNDGVRILSEGDTDIFKKHNELVSVDAVCTCENLKDEIRRVFKQNHLKLGLKSTIKLFRMKKVHTSKHAHYREYYDSEIRELVRYKDRLIIDTYGYDF